jgi:transketolase
MLNDQVNHSKRLERYRKLAQMIRAYAIKMTNLEHSGHVGSSLSMAELIAVLYDGILRVDPKNPRWPDRDRFILSKGHAAAGLYGALAEKGFFPKWWTDTYYRDNGKLCGHISHHVPGVEFSTGSLGHGLPVAAGMALVAKRERKNYRIFVLMSDGDCNEGSTWEAIMFAAQHRFDNLIAIVDANKIQALGEVKDIINMEPLARKLEVFGWEVREIDGHDVKEIEKTLLSVPFKKGKPSFIIARTIKGKGVKFLENTIASHYRCVPDDKLADVYRELGIANAFCI